MRARFFLVVLLNFGLSMGMSAIAQSSQTQPADTRILQIQNRIETGDESAFEEAAHLPINQAVSLLKIYALETGANKARTEQARKVLGQLPGFSDYMKQRLLELRSKPAGEYDMGEEFELLVAIGGDSAAAAAAPFLFVDDPPVLLSNDAGASPIKYQAVKALANMHLPDRPVNKEYYDLNEEDKEVWRDWAIKKGYKDNSIPNLGSSATSVFRRAGMG